jgi:hypothetical protein
MFDDVVVFHYVIVRDDANALDDVGTEYGVKNAFVIPVYSSLVYFRFLFVLIAVIR